MLGRTLFPAPGPKDAASSGPAGWRTRSESPSRLECFSDSVFAFALTLLVVSLEAPMQLDALYEKIPYFAGFAGAFAILVVLWYRHAVFFRRYALEDRTTVALNAAYLFVVLFYVYPLRFLAMTLSAVVVGAIQGHGPLVRLPTGVWDKPMTISQMPGFMTLYLVGWGAVMGVSAAMHAHALRRRQALDLTEWEAAATRSTVVTAAAIAITSGALALASLLGMPLQLAVPVLLLVVLPLRMRQRRLHREAATS
jgi:transmembrane protein TMEM174 (potassium channel)